MVDGDSENEEIEVRTQFGGTPSRPASRIGSRSTSPTRLASRKREKEQDAVSLDPLRRLPNPISANIFRRLESTDLKTCQRVSKRWKRSQTLNWCWYCMFQGKAFSDVVLPEKPVWTRRDSKQDWATKYKSAFRKDDLEYAHAEDADEDRLRADGWQTPREEQEERWRDENDAGLVGLDKVQARLYYKSLKNSKAKSKGSGTRSPGRLRDMGGSEGPEE